MEILFTSLHQIDHSNAKINEVDITQTSPDLVDYVEKLFDEITTNSNNRKFKFASENSEVRLSIDKFLQNGSKKASEINADRLLRIETQAQEEVSRLSIEIQKGSLFQAVIQEQNLKRIIISKAEHSIFLDENDFQRHSGLPWKRKIFKAFIAEIDETNAISKIFVYDTNIPMAKYWWRDFLELCETYTDSYNTIRSLDLLDRKIFNDIKSDFPADHTLLRNSSIKYFRSQSEFDLGNYIDQVFSGYDPVDPGFPQEKILQTIRGLPEKWGFDSRFSIVREDIKKRMINRIQLTDKIDLILNDFIDNIGSVIVSDIENDGKKYIKIYTDSGYERFKN